MKPIIHKLCCCVLALSLLLTGCGQPGEEPSGGNSTVAATGSVASTTSTTAGDSADSTDATASNASIGTANTGTQVSVTKPGTTAGTATPGASSTKNKHNDTLTNQELFDKLLGGWIGQMAGVALFAKTEFGAQGKILSQERMDAAMKEWENGTVSINDAFHQDDLYVEIPFMDAMKAHGAFCAVEKLADAFKQTTFPLWHANAAARTNLLGGIPYPESGHYLYNKHADDIDWQIECDFLGAMYPGLVNAAAKRSFDIGHIMNYGDGVYGGVFVTAMHAAAYTADSVDEVIRAGLAVIPDKTLFKDTMNLVMDSYAAGDTWEQCWQKLEKTYAPTDKCPDMSTSAANIDAKLNAAYILVGLLWGEGDFEQTMVISGRCGQDSDCNPSSAAAILGNLYGASKIPEKYKKGLDYSGRKFATTRYTLSQILALNLSLAKEVLIASGATEKNGVWSLTKDTKYTPVAYEQWDDGNFDAGLTVVNIGNGVVKLTLDTLGDEAVDSVTMDMGDGFVAHGNLAYYNYQKAGEYTIRYTVVSDKGTVIKRQRKVQVRQTLADVTPICTVTAPTGGGSRSLTTICDGVVPYITDTNPAIQYDTYDGGGKKTSVYVGLQFAGTHTLDRVEFTEGMHFSDGGWFVRQPDVEVLVDGQWEKVSTTISSAYPTGNTQTAHGNSYDNYVFTFPSPITCKGVRLVGQPGGSASFISVGEITPILSASDVTDTFTNNAFPLVICDETYPRGGGIWDLRVITDGKKGTSGHTQYDTYDFTGKSRTEYVGILYREARKVTVVTFTEGCNTRDGGWFKNGVTVEALVDGQWKAVACTASPDYPIGDSQALFGGDGDTYVFTLKTPVTCTGIRIIGEAGGPAHFISVSEFTVG